MKIYSIKSNCNNHYNNVSFGVVKIELPVDVYNQVKIEEPLPKGLVQFEIKTGLLGRTYLIFGKTIDAECKYYDLMKQAITKMYQERGYEDKEIKDALKEVISKDETIRLPEKECTLTYPSTKLTSALTPEELERLGIYPDDADDTIKDILS